VSLIAGSVKYGDHWWSLLLLIAGWAWLAIVPDLITKRITGSVNGTCTCSLHD
jgi:hypothetical protein